MKVNKDLDTICCHVFGCVKAARKITVLYLLVLLELSLLVMKCWVYIIWCLIGFTICGAFSLLHASLHALLVLFFFRYHNKFSLT